VEIQFNDSENEDNDEAGPPSCDVCFLFFNLVWQLMFCLFFVQILYEGRSRNEILAKGATDIKQRLQAFNKSSREVRNSASVIMDVIRC